MSMTFKKIFFVATLVVFQASIYASDGANQKSHKKTAYTVAGWASAAAGVVSFSVAALYGLKLYITLDDIEYLRFRDEPYFLEHPELPPYETEPWRLQAYHSSKYTTIVSALLGTAFCACAWHLFSKAEEEDVEEDNLTY